MITIRGFHHWAEAWYSKNRPHSQGVHDEVMFGLYCKDEDGNDEGCKGEMAVRWVLLGTPTAHLEIFEDSWAVLASMPDVVQALGKLAGTNPKPEQIIAALLELGFQDLTERKGPGALLVV